MPVIIIGGMKTGVFTPTEAAVVAAFYALAVALLVHREMKLSRTSATCWCAPPRPPSIVLFLAAGAAVASYMITLADLPGVLAGWLGPLVENPRVLMAAMMIVLVLIGTSLDLTPTILIFAPVMLPIAVKAGIDPVYFGLMFVLNGAHRPDHAAGGHRAQRGRQRRPHPDAQRRQGRQPVPDHLCG